MTDHDRESVAPAKPATAPSGAIPTPPPGPASDAVDVRPGGWMLTHSGRRFYPEDIRPEDIRIEDIAHALSNICRFGGHCRTFYSVAQHSVLVSGQVPPGHRRQALLHDAAEAYVGDMVRPVKLTTWMTHYVAFERSLQRQIYTLFEVSAETSAAVHHADHQLLATEYRQLFDTPDVDGWFAGADPIEGLSIHPWEPRAAELRFLHAWTVGDSESI